MRFPGLFRILLFFTLFALIAVPLHIAIDTGMRRTHQFPFGALNTAFYSRENPEIVITGSSRAVHHFDPRVLTRITGMTALNIGRVASHSEMQLAILQAYLRHKRPRLLIHSLDYFTGIRAAEVFNLVQYAPYLDEPELYATLARYTPNLWRWRFIPLYRYLAIDPWLQWRFGLGALVDRGEDDPRNGFDARPPKWNSAFNNFRARKTLRFDSQKAGLGDIESFAALCEAYAIPTVFVFSPVYQEYREMVSNGREVIQDFKDIANRHHLLFLDYSEDPMTRPKEHFYDPNHLNARGAAVFSEDLAAKLKEMLPLQARDRASGVNVSRGPQPSGRLADF